MNQYKVSQRLYAIVAVSLAVMLVLAIINWTVMTRLADLQDQGVRKAEAAARIKHDSNLGAQAYRVIADTYINRNFDEVQKKWVEIKTEIDASIDFANKIADTAEEKAALRDATAAYQEIRTLYEGKYLELSKANAPRDELGPVDDAVDKQVDRFDEGYTKMVKVLQDEATALDQAFDVDSRCAHQDGRVHCSGWLAVGFADAVDFEEHHRPTRHGIGRGHSAGPQHCRWGSDPHVYPWLLQPGQSGQRAGPHAGYAQKHSHQCAPGF